MNTVAGADAVVAVGVLMAAICEQTRQDSRCYPEAVAGALFLLAGAITPFAGRSRLRPSGPAS